MKTRYWFFPMLFLSIVLYYTNLGPVTSLPLAFCVLYAIVKGIKTGIKRITTKKIESKNFI